MVTDILEENAALSSECFLLKFNKKQEYVCVTILMLNNFLNV
jgi:hypothetical protein